MLLECKNCGAPLDVTKGARSVRCNYCGTASEVKSSRTVAFETPKDWVPPPAWTPPPEKNLGEQSLVYHAAKRTLRTVVSLITFGVVVSLGIGAYGFMRVVGDAAAPLASLQGTDIQQVMNQAMVAMEQAKGMAAAAQLAAGSPPVTLPVTCSGNQSLTLQGQSLMLESGTPLLVSGNCTLRLVACTVSGDTGVEVSDNGRVVVEGGSITAKGPAVSLSSNATLEASAAELTGEPALSARGNAQARVRGSRVTGRSIAVQTSGNARVDTEGAIVQGKVSGSRKKK